MAHSLRLALPVVVLGSIAACVGATQEEDPSAGDEQGLARTTEVAEGSGRTTRPPRDSGVADTSKPFTPPLAPMTPTLGVLAACAPARYDIRLSSGRTCAAFAKTTATGTWTVAPLFPSAPAAIRDASCAVTWHAIAPTCAAPDLTALALNCQENLSKAERSAACAADPAACTVSSLAQDLGTKETPRVPGSCEPIIIDGGIPGGYAGGCDSCGIIHGGLLYLTNPYGKSSIFTNVSTPAGVQQLNVLIPPFTSTAVNMPGYPNGPIYIWPGY